MSLVLPSEELHYMISDFCCGYRQIEYKSFFSFYRELRVAVVKRLHQLPYLLSMHFFG